MLFNIFDFLCLISRLKIIEVSDLDHPRGVKKSKKIPPKSGSPAWFLVLFGHPILAGGYDEDSTHLELNFSNIPIFWSVVVLVVHFSS